MKARCRSTMIWLGLGALAGTAGLKAASDPDAFRARVRRCQRRAERSAQRATGRLAGLGYRLSGRQPDESVPDLVLADRVRSEIGPLIKTLDLPHVHVMVNDRIAMLHGETATEDEAAEIAHAVLEVAGIRGVRSHLHIGLLPSDTRPSVGRAQRPPSAALERLTHAASAAGATSAPLFTVQSVLSTFLERLPDGERAHVIAHLPDDVRQVASPPKVWGDDRIGTLAELVAEVAATDPNLDDASAQRVTEAVLAVLADLVPEEGDDITAVLPHELRDLWTSLCVRNRETTDVPTAV